MKCLFCLLGAALMLAFSACSRPPEAAASVAPALAAQLDSDLRELREEVERLASTIASLYARRSEIIQGVDKSKYTFSLDGAFYKPKDDGGAALWISAVQPVTPEMQEVAYLTEPLDAELIRICRERPAVSQAYYNDRFSLNRIYPWFDTLAQYPPRMNIAEFNFYYLADAAHNPARKGVWVPEPYLDPAGRGWMVSTIAPVYVDEKLEGVPGLDVTIATLVEHYFRSLEQAVAVVSREGVLVAATESAIQYLEMPPLRDHKYLETVKLDTFKPEDYNILKSTLRPVRTMATQLLREHLSPVTVVLKGEPHTACAVAVPELGWTVIELYPN